VRLIKLGGSLAAAKLADDAVDGAIGPTKARYVATSVSAALIIFQKGGEARLHKGDTVEIEPRRAAQWKSETNPRPQLAPIWPFAVFAAVPRDLHVGLHRSEPQDKACHP
jgi:hypothetical protein